jgi:tetraacyldisaccharide 4'-kinase
VSWLYGAAARLHRHAYRAGWRPRRRFSGHVISVGNLVVGGTGKTPTAAWIASRLHRRGRRVALLSRGVGGRSREPVCVVSDGRRVRTGVAEAGDEALVLAAHAPGVPVLVGPDRWLAGLRALSAFGSEILVLDDGFHHHRLERDLDVLTVDGAQGFGNRCVLPRGPLREPVSALRRADAVVVVDGPLAADDAELLARWTPGASRVEAQRRPVDLRPLDGGPGAPLEVLDGASVGMLAGLARPESLRRTLERLGAKVVAERLFGDHHRYGARDLEGLDREAPLWITTEKDAIKILPYWLGRADLRVLGIELEIDQPSRFLDWIESTLR